MQDVFENLGHGPLGLVGHVRAKVLAEGSPQKAIGKRSFGFHSIFKGW
jgi:hypothetical protein